MNTTEKNAEQAAEAWTGKLGAYSRSTRTIALALAAHYDKSELAATLAHEGIGHSGINTFSCAEKRGLIDAIIESRKHPGALRDSYWKAVEDAYPNLRKSEQAEEIFSLMAETVQRVGRDSWAVSNLKCNTLTEGNVRKWERDTNTCSQKTE